MKESTPFDRSPCLWKLSRCSCHINTSTHTPCPPSCAGAAAPAAKYITSTQSHTLVTRPAVPKLQLQPCLQNEAMAHAEACRRAANPAGVLRKGFPRHPRPGRAGRLQQPRRGRAGPPAATTFWSSKAPCSNRVLLGSDPLQHRWEGRMPSHGSCIHASSLTPTVSPPRPARSTVSDTGIGFASPAAISASSSAVTQVWVLASSSRSAHAPRPRSASSRMKRSRLCGVRVGGSASTRREPLRGASSLYMHFGMDWF
eukprot:319-Chlamydomonas_euryale.AAC.2